MRIALKKQRKIINSLRTKFRPPPPVPSLNEVKERRTATTHQSRAAVTDYYNIFNMHYTHMGYNDILSRFTLHYE